MKLNQYPLLQNKALGYTQKQKAVKIRKKKEPSQEKILVSILFIIKTRAFLHLAPPKLFLLQMAITNLYLHK